MKGWGKGWEKGWVIGDVGRGKGWVMRGRRVSTGGDSGEEGDLSFFFIFIILTFL